MVLGHKERDVHVETRQVPELQVSDYHHIDGSVGRPSRLVGPKEVAVIRDTCGHDWKRVVVPDSHEVVLDEIKDYAFPVEVDLDIGMVSLETRHKRDHGRILQLVSLSSCY